MPILNEDRAKHLTERLFNKVLDNLSESDEVAAEWWEKHKIELVGLTTSEVISTFNASQRKKDLAKKYEELVQTLTWKEKVALMRSTAKDLRKANSEKLRQAALIDALIDATPRIIVAILLII